jgi:hypothetical protein
MEREQFAFVAATFRWAGRPTYRKNLGPPEGGPYETKPTALPLSPAFAADSSYNAVSPLFAADTKIPPGVGYAYFFKLGDKCFRRWYLAPVASIMLSCTCAAKGVVHSARAYLLPAAREGSVCSDQDRRKENQSVNSEPV